jgi:hypothetical protein
VADAGPAGATEQLLDVEDILVPDMVALCCKSVLQVAAVRGIPAAHACRIATGGTMNTCAQHVHMQHVLTCVPVL